MVFNTLVTGGAGFIGSHIAEALARHGHRVVVVDNRSRPFDGSAVTELEGVEYVWADLRDMDTVQRIVRGIDVVVHQAAQVGVGHSMFEIHRYADANVSGTAALLQAITARDAQVRQLVVASSMSVYGEGLYSCGNCGLIRPPLRDYARLAAGLWEQVCPHCGREPVPVPIPETAELRPTSVYGVSKRSQEEFCLVTGNAYAIPTTCFRYFGVYGRGQLMTNPYTGMVAMFAARLANRRQPLVFEDGRQYRDLVHVTDICRAVLSVIEKPIESGPVNLGSGHAVPVTEIAKMLAEHLAPDIKPEISRTYRKGDIRNCYPDLTRAMQLFGFSPQIPLDQGIADFADWVKHHPAPESIDVMRAELGGRGLVV